MVGVAGVSVALMPAERGVGEGLTGDPPPQAPKWVASTKANTDASTGADRSVAPKRREGDFRNVCEYYRPESAEAIPGVGVGEGGTGQFRPNPPLAVNSAVWHNKYPGRRRAKSTSRTTSDTNAA